jgi:hypothetical protein
MREALVDTIFMWTSCFGLNSTRGIFLPFVDLNLFVVIPACFSPLSWGNGKNPQITTRTCVSPKYSRLVPLPMGDNDDAPAVGGTYIEIEVLARAKRFRPVSGPRCPLECQRPNRAQCHDPARGSRLEEAIRGGAG